MMFPDNPLLDPTQDKFNRFPFSQRIAEVIASRRDSSSIVIGIYGSWGEGKTTVFNFVEKSLETNSNIICIRFNPWLFRDEDKLLLSFFKTLADVLERKLTTKIEDLGKGLEKLGGIFAPLSLADPTGVGVVRGSGQILEKLGNLFSQVELEESKKRIDKILDEEKKRLVIFIDDIDRLDKSEIQSIFKLVKLSADFKNTIYLLAFDRDKVASAISEKYGSGDIEAGRSFLEKIIQLPLTLPQVSSRALLNFCSECVDEALKNADLELTDEEIRRFVKSFSESLLIQIKTPRLALRYGNIITFSIPLLKGEVNVVDLLLIEGVKAFYPKLYNSIKEKPSYFLGEVLDRGGAFEEIKNIIIDFIEQSISDISQEAQIYAKKLLQELFPRLTGILGNIHHGSDWQKKWTQEKRIASLDYFKRYFAYSIPEDDISDQDLMMFLNQLEQANIFDISNEIKKITNHQGLKIDSFLTKIFQKFDDLSVSSSRNLALALAQIGDFFPIPERLFYTASPFSRAGILVSYLILKVEVPDKRLEFCKQIIQTAKPISFATECFKWISATKRDNENKDSEKVFSESEIKSLAELVVNRIRDVTQEEAIDIASPQSIFELLGFWAFWSSRQETNSYLRKIFNQNPNHSVDFLKLYIPTVQPIDMEPPYLKGSPFKGTLQRNDYDAIISVVDADLLIESLQKIYGDKLNSSEIRTQNDAQSVEELAASQFVEIYNQVVAESKG